MLLSLHSTTFVPRPIWQPIPNKFRCLLAQRFAPGLAVRIQVWALSKPDGTISEPLAFGIVVERGGMKDGTVIPNC